MLCSFSSALSLSLNPVLQSTSKLLLLSSPLLIEAAAELTPAGSTAACLLLNSGRRLGGPACLAARAHLSLLYSCEPLPRIAHSAL